MNAPILHAHGPLRFAIPPSWSDQSTLMFVGPQLEDEAQAPVVTLTFAVAKSNARSTAVLEVERMSQVAPDLKLVEEGSFSSAFGDGWSVRVTVERGKILLTQVTCTQQVGPMMLLMTALCEAEHFARHQKNIEEMFSSIQPANALEPEA